MHRQTEDISVADFEFCGVSLDIKSIGEVFGQRGTLTRRLSIQRAATVKDRTSVCQVIIKNTGALKGSDDLSADSSMNRSQSLLETHKVPTLVSKRTDRIQMEHALTSVWTKDRLPFPGMSSGLLARTSASSMMRKLSRASTHSKSATRTVSCASIPETNESDQKPTHQVSDHPNIVPNIIRSYDGAGSLEEDSLSAAVVSRKSSKLSKSTWSRSSCGGSSTSTVIASQGSGELRPIIKGKLRKPRTLLKAFSTEGIRSWFSGRRASETMIHF